MGRYNELTLSEAEALFGVPALQIRYRVAQARLQRVTLPDTATLSVGQAARLLCLRIEGAHGLITRGAVELDGQGRIPLGQVRRYAEKKCRSLDGQTSSGGWRQEEGKKNGRETG